MSHTPRQSRQQRSLSMRSSAMRSSTSPRNSASNRHMNVKGENWTDFHRKHHSNSFRNSSERVFQNGGCAHLCLGGVEENGSWFMDWVGSLVNPGGSTPKNAAFADDDSLGSQSFHGGRGRRRVFGRNKKPRGNIRIDSIPTL